MGKNALKNQIADTCRGKKEMERVEAVARDLKKFMDGETCDAVVVCGSGIAEAGRVFEDVRFTEMKKVSKHIPRPGIPGHNPALGVSKIGGLNVLKVFGRVHLYEGYSLDATTRLLKAARLCGAERVLLTNAVGALHEELTPGSVLAVKDHLNLAGAGVLVGTPMAKSGAAFLEGDKIWSPAMIEASKKPAVTLVQLIGPVFESPAEVQWLKTIGADVVGMSVVSEALVAKAAGFEVGALSFVANWGSGISNLSVTHEEVLQKAKDNANEIAVTLEKTLTA